MGIEQLSLQPPVPLTSTHVATDFDCGVDSLNEWLGKRAWKNQAIGVSLSLYTQIAQSTSSRKYQFPELTPEEIARRVAAFERFQERQRQRWESLTPEEQAEHDRQFEALYKSLNERTGYPRPRSVEC